MIPSLLARLRALLSRGRHEAELDEELQYHLHRDTERRIAGGMEPAAARAAALREFGRLSEHQDAVRSAWRWQWVDELRQDLRFALRAVRREPGLVATVMVTIGLGVGPFAAAFTLFNAYVLRPVPVADPRGLTGVEWNSRERSGHRLSWAQYTELQRLPIVTSAIGYREFNTRSEQRSVVGHFVTGNYFAMLGVGPALGRVLQGGDTEAPGAAPVAVLNHRYWTARYGADPAAVGQALRIRGVTFTIVGVGSPGFDGLAEAPDFWAPATMLSAVEGRPDFFTDPTAEMLDVVVRFRRDVTPEQAAPVLETWLRGVVATGPDNEQLVGVSLRPAATLDSISPDMILSLLPIIAAFGLVLLAACANVASLMVARGVARQREIGIRLAIGAGRPRLIRQLLTESLLLALPAALAGFLFSRLIITGSIAVLDATMPDSFRTGLRMAPLEADYRVHLFVALAAGLSAVVFGLLPALQATRPGIMRATRGEFGDDLKPSRLRRGLVIGQIAVAAVLLISTGVMLASNQRARRVEIGFSTSGVMVMHVAERARVRAIEQLRARPEVLGVASSNVVPLLGTNRLVSVQAKRGAALHSPLSLAVSAGFFDVLGIRLSSGRAFSEDEARAGAAVAIVNEALAAQLWGGARAVDQTVLLIDRSRAAPGEPAMPRETRVVGVAPDVVTGWIGDKPNRPTIFLPTRLAGAGNRVIVKTNDASLPGQLALEETVTAVEPGALDAVFSLDDIVTVTTYPFRLASWIGLAIGLIALVLTLSGVYGVLAYTVARRSREIGVRVALGATQARVVKLVMGESVRLAAWGIGVGLVVAAGVAAAAAGLIEVMRVFEPLAYLGGAAAVLAACVVGAVVPSRRAARVDPLEAIRAD